MVASQSGSIRPHVRMLGLRKGALHGFGLAMGATLILWASDFKDGRPLFTLADDAMISMSYGRTLAGGDLWLWYPDAPVVQGFTNLLWSLFMACIHLLGAEGVIASYIVSLTGLALVGISASLVGVMSRDINPDGKVFGIQPEFIGTFLAYASYPLLYWSSRGFEVGLVTFLTIALLRLIQVYEANGGKGPAVGILLVTILGISTRVDFVVAPLAIAAVFLLYLVWVRKNRILHIALLLMGASALGVGMVLCFQFLYWGDPLPNTYYLKATGVELITRLERGALSSLKLMPIVLVGALLGLRLWQEGSSVHRKPLLLALGATAASLLAYSVYVGGDVWDDFLFANRYVTPILTLVAILIAAQPANGNWKSIGGVDVRAWALLVTLSGAFLGATTNNPPSIVRALLGPLVIGLIFTLTVRGSSKKRNHLISSRFSVAFAAILIASGSLSGLASAVVVGKPQAVSADLAKMGEGLEIAAVTRPGAIILVAWAGNPVYFSERPALDLLGKNDSKIARMSPPDPVPGTFNEKFIPGHNKWSFQTSVVEGRPDLIFQFMDHPGERESLKLLGYQARCLPNSHTEVYVAESSLLVNFEKLVSCETFD